MVALVAVAATDAVVATTAARPAPALAATSDFRGDGRDRLRSSWGLTGKAPA